MAYIPGIAARWLRVKKAALLLLILAVAPGIARAEEVTLSFDGSTEPGKIYVKEGGSAPTFVAGVQGQAVLFNEGTVVAIPLDIDARRYPHVAVSMWLKASANAASQAWLFTPGDGNNLPFIHITSGRHITVMGRLDNGNAIPASDTVLPIDEWVQVFVEWDYDKRSIRMQVGSEVKTFDNVAMNVAAGQVQQQRLYVAPGSPAGAESQPYVFIGARNFRYGLPAKGYAVDDLHISTGVLSTAAKQNPVATGSVAPATTDASPAYTAGTTCAAMADCTTGNYCAFDHTCHPDSHLPLQTLVTGQVPVTTGTTSIATLPSATPSVSGTSSGAVGAASGPLLGDLTTAIPTEAVGDMRASKTIEKTPQESGSQQTAAAGVQPSSAETATGQQALESSGPHPVGDARYSMVAGVDSGQTHRLDYVNAFINQIGWDEEADMPCKLAIFAPHGSPYFKGGDFGCPNPISTTVKPPEYLEHSVSLADAFIGSIEVCNNNRNNQRMKGLRILGDTINPDGSTTYHPATDEEFLPHCDKWSPSVLCPIDTLSTGVIVYTTDAGDFHNQIVGLQLICRAIGVN